MFSQSVDTVNVLFSFSVLLRIVSIWYIKYFWVSFSVSSCTCTHGELSLVRLICYVRSRSSKVLTSANNFKHRLTGEQVNVKYGPCNESDPSLFWWICVGPCPSAKAFGTAQSWVSSTAVAKGVVQVTSQNVRSYFFIEGCAECRRIKNYAEIQYVYMFCLV